jgi:hypothetical protein
MNASAAVRRSTCLLLATVGLLAAPPAGADWTTQRMGSLTRDGGFEVASNARGDVAVAWGEKGGVRLAVSRDGGAFEKRRTVPGSADGRDPRLAMNARGDVLVAYRWFDGTRGSAWDDEYGCCDNARAVVYSHDGEFRPVRQIAPRGRSAWLYSIAIDPRGRAAVAWTRSLVGGSLLARLSAPDGGPFGPNVRIDNRGDGVAVSVVRGRARVLFFRTAGSSGAARLNEREFDRRGGRGPVHLVATGLTTDVAVNTATTPDGLQVVAWANEPPAPADLYAGVRRVGRPLDAVKVSDRGESLARVAIAPSGAAAVAWARDDEIFLAARSAGEGFRAAFTLDEVAAPGTPVGFPSLAVDSRARALLSWPYTVNPGEERLRSVYVHASGNVLAAGDVAAPTPPFALSTGGPRTAALDGTGRATIAWRREHDLNVSRADLR